MKQKGWLNVFLSLATGAAVTAFVLATITGLQQPQQAQDHIAEKKGWHVASYKTLRELTDKTDRGVKLNESEWHSLRKIIDTYPDADFRMRAIVLLRSQKGTPHEEEAVGVAESLLKDESSFAVASALRALMDLNPERAKVAARRLVTHSSDTVSGRARLILGK